MSTAHVIRPHDIVVVKKTFRYSKIFSPTTDAALPYQVYIIEKRHKIPLTPLAKGGTTDTDQSVSPGRERTMPVVNRSPLSKKGGQGGFSMVTCSRRSTYFH
jgi:hypothetical protein